MNTKRLIPVMFLSLAIIMGWEYLVMRWREAHPELAQPTTLPATTQSFATTQQAVATTQVATTQPGPSMTAGVANFTPAPATQPVSSAAVVLGAGPNYVVTLRVTPRAGAIESATLKRPDGTPFKGPGGEGEYVYQTPFDVADPGTYALATRELVINDERVDVSRAVWNVEKVDDATARLTLEIQSAGKPVLRAHKLYQVVEKTKPGKGYELNLSQRFENLSDQPMTVKAVLNGPTQPPREIERGLDLQVVGAYDDERDVIVSSHPVEGFDQKHPTIDLTTTDKKQPFLWVGTASVYFNALYRPIPSSAKAPDPQYVGKVTGEALNPTSEPHLRQVRVNFETAGLLLGAKEKVELPGALFLGPKWREVLKDPYYAAFPRGYDKTLVIVSGPCAFCTFYKLIDVLVWILGVFHAVLRDWGLAIICLVVVVRAILHPITKRSQIAMAKMQKMGPEIERLKKKYGDNKDELNKAMWEFQKEQGITPILGCLPMFLQMPIWIALWSCLQSTFELRQAPFLYGMTWIHDLAKPDQLIKFPQPIPLLFFGWHLDAINLLPLLMVLVTWINFKYQPKPMATTPEQEQQQKMMQWMSLLIPLMFYALPSGLNLYYVTSMGLGIIESKIIRDHIKQREEAEKEGRVIVDAGSKKRRRDDGDLGLGAKRKPTAPKSGFGKWLSDIQAKAEELRKQAEKK